MAKEKLSASQQKMKSIFDQHAERRVFAEGDCVLALLPLVTSPFQARFSGPYEVLKQLSDLNYLISTPDRRKKTQLCHVNLLKPYLDRVPSMPDVGKQLSVGETRPVCSIGRTSTIHVPEVVAAEVEDGMPELDPSVLPGRLKNSETLCNLEGLLGHLPQPDQSELGKTIFIISSPFW